MLPSALLVIISREMNFANTVLNVQHLCFSMLLRMMKSSFQTSLAYLFVCLFVRLIIHKASHKGQGRAEKPSHDSPFLRNLKKLKIHLCSWCIGSFSCEISGDLHRKHAQRGLVLIQCVPEKKGFGKTWKCPLCIEQVHPYLTGVPVPHRCPCASQRYLHTHQRMT